MGRKQSYVRIAVKPDTYVLLREIMNELVLRHKGFKLLCGKRLTIDLVVKEALMIYKAYLKNPEKFPVILGDEVAD